jgi:putative heme-binding domain-containing protein
LDNVDLYSAELKKLINPTEPAEVQQITVQTLAQTKGPEISQFFLDKWNSLTPEIRERSIDLFMKEPARMRQLLDGIEQGTVQVSTVGWRRSVRLMNHEDVSIRNQARRLLDEKPGLREETAKRYQVALTLTGDPAKGKAVFNQVCATCHQMGNTEGKAFGPDLASLKNRRPEAIMKDILMPNRSIADGYEWWEIKEKSGKIYTGIIGNETTSTITLRNITGPEITISRNTIDSLKASDVSAMPTGLENLINEQQMADLLAFIKQTRI